MVLTTSSFALERAFRFLFVARPSIDVLAIRQSRDAPPGAATATPSKLAGGLAGGVAVNTTPGSGGKTVGTWIGFGSAPDEELAARQCALELNSPLRTANVFAPILSSVFSVRFSRVVAAPGVLSARGKEACRAPGFMRSIPTCGTSSVPSAILPRPHVCTAPHRTAVYATSRHARSRGVRWRRTSQGTALHSASPTPSD